MSRTAEKLRAEGLVARGLQVFITTKKHGKRLRYANACSATLPRPTNYTPELTLHEKTCLERIYREGPAYKKADVMLYELTAEEPEQRHLFEERSPDEAALTDATRSGQQRHALAGRAW